MDVVRLTYHRPDTLAHARELAGTLAGDSRFLAGGTELLPGLRTGRQVARNLISLKRIPDLRGIRSTADGLDIGAMSTLAEVAASATVKRVFPALAEAAGQMAAVQVRNRGTLGGNFCGAVPCADTPPVCITAEASVHILGTAGERWVPAEDFFVAPRATVLEPAELVIAIRIPVQPANSGGSFQRFTLRGGNALAVASVVARVTMNDGEMVDARIAMGAVSPVPLRAKEAEGVLRGNVAGAEIFERAAEMAAAEARPISDVRGSVEFRRELVKVLTVRALRAACNRAEGLA